jgi:hypothetical protein
LCGVTDTDCNPDGNGDCYCDGYRDGDGNNDSNSNSNSNTDTYGYNDSEGYSDAETSADSPPAPDTAQLGPQALAGNVITVIGKTGTREKTSRVPA